MPRACSRHWPARRCLSPAVPLAARHKNSATDGRDFGAGTGGTGNLYFKSTREKEVTKDIAIRRSYNRKMPVPPVPAMPINGVSRLRATCYEFSLR